MGNPRHEIQYVDPPASWADSVVTKRIEGTRWFEEEGSAVLFHQWMRELQDEMKKKRAGLLIPLQWVPDYVRVSRAAVHKRASRGGLTVFSYIIKQPSAGLLGWTKDKPRARYDLVPVKECDQWRELLMELHNQQLAADDE